MPDRIGMIGPDGLSTGDLCRHKKRILLIRCGDDEKFDRCCPGKFEETPLQHFTKLYEVCYQHTEPGCCLCMGDSKLSWQDPQDIYKRLAFLIPRKRPDFIGLSSHGNCAAYVDRFGELTEDRERDLCTQDLIEGQNMIGEWFPEFKPAGKTLLFFLDRKHHFRAVGQDTLTLHQQQLRALSGNGHG